MTGFLIRISSLPDRLLARLGPWPWAVVAGLCVVALASLVAAPSTTPAGMLGELNVQLSSDPFGGTPNAVAPRILAPLLGWVLGLRGDGFLILIAAFCVLLPAAVARWTLARGFNALDAVLAAGVFGLTLLTRTSLHYGGVPDVVTYLLVFVLWVGRKCPWTVSACLLLALLSHERTLFLLPWILWLVWREAGDDRRRRRIFLVGIGLAVAVWAASHLAIVSHRDVEQSAGYYMRPLLGDPLTHVRQAWPWQPLGFLSAFQWLWLLPLTWAWNTWRRGDRSRLAMLILPVACAACQMFFAYDSSRLAALAFPCLLPALEDGLRDGGPVFRVRLASVLLLQTFTPQVFTASYIVEVMSGWIW